MEKKITKKEMFVMISKIAEIRENAMLSDFIAHEIELLERKSAAPRKPSKTQTANLELGDEIVELMEPAPMVYSVSEITKLINSKTGSEYSTQKLSRIMKNLSEQGKVIRTESKKKVVYQKA